MFPILSSLIALGLFFQWRNWRPLPPTSGPSQALSSDLGPSGISGVHALPNPQQTCCRLLWPIRGWLGAEWLLCARARAHTYLFLAVPTPDSQGTAQGQPLGYRSAGWLCLRLHLYSHPSPGSRGQSRFLLHFLWRWTSQRKWKVTDSRDD